MYILTLSQNEIKNTIGVFSTMENAKAFVQLIPGYECRVDQSDPDYEYEIIRKDKLDDYLEIHYQDLIYPLSRFSFPGEEDIDVEWLDIPLLDGGGQGLVDYATRVDAFIIANDQVRSYIETREAGYRKVAEILKKRACQVERAFAGSEDGEAILYRRPGQPDYHFLCHLDACTVEEWKSVTDWEGWVESQMI